ncbi:MAG: glucose 1-dehydrogenase [Acidobacteriia bacterium]|nr:glucose 1-dehydrogenase [Terriglobia bacterium]
MNRNMEGKVALVTGASGGIWLATARKFAKAGASIALCARRTEVINKEVTQLIAEGFKALAVSADVTHASQASAMVARTVEHFGRLDYAVNNAGVINERVATHEHSEQEWDRVISINLTAVWLCMKYELAQMVRQGFGAIVNISSVAGLRATPRLAAYTASKHGVVGLSKGAGVEYASQGIRVNAICPGWVETPMTADYGSNPEHRQQMVASAPIGRTAQPDEIAEAVVWLCSDAASFITADAIAVDGGTTA